MITAPNKLAAQADVAAFGLCALPPAMVRPRRAATGRAPTAMQAPNENRPGRGGRRGGLVPGGGD